MAHQLSIQTPSGGAYDTLKPTVRTTPSHVRTCCPILIYTTRSTFDETMLGHLRQTVTTRIPPLAERNDRNDGKPPPPPTIPDSCLSAIMTSQKSHPIIKGDRASDTIKGPSRKEKRYTFLLRKKRKIDYQRKS